MGCNYVKIPCVGKTPPTRYQVNEFINICWNFWNENSSLIIGKLFILLIHLIDFKINYIFISTIMNITII